VEYGNVIKLNDEGDLAAYIIHLSVSDEGKEAILNSKVLDFCVNALTNNAA
jgi:hypothetical protein